MHIFKGPRKAGFWCKRTLKINPIMKVLCMTWPLNLIKCHYRESKYVYQGRNACQSGQILSACFNLGIHARSVMWVCFNLSIRARSVTEVSDVTDRHWGEWWRRHVFTIDQSTTKMPCECAAMGCTELQTKGSLFCFHTFPKDSSRRKLHPWRFELEIVPGRLPCGHTHKHGLFTKGISHASPGFR